jgi:hypothetical protein
MWSWVVTMGQLLKEVLAMVSQDVLQPAWVSLEMERRGFLPDFLGPFLGSPMPYLFQLFVQCLARDVIVVTKLQEEVTWAWATAVMAEACTAQVERMAKERVIPLATAHREVDKAAQRVSFLEGELVAMHRARDTT